jgi:uncharacterized protein (TIGR04141 family)
LQEQILYALRQVEAGKKVSEVCREMGVSQQAVYSWKRRYAGLGLNEPRELRQLREKKRHLLDEEREAFTTYSVYDCFGCELTHSGTSYVLSSGTWHQVVPEFLTQVSNYVDNIDKPPIALPAWNGAENEGEYNTRCGNLPGFLHFDTADVLFGGGPSRFEFCDFLHQKSKSLFFAKVGARSSGMSHLVEQVRRTAELLFNVDGSYRAELAKVFKKYHPNTDRGWLKSRPSNADWNLCLVSLGRPAKTLPFFVHCTGCTEV